MRKNSTIDKTPKIIKENIKANLYLKIRNIKKTNNIEVKILFDKFLLII